jgi:hypothetical protein
MFMIRVRATLDSTRLGSVRRRVTSWIATYTLCVALLRQERFHERSRHILTISMGAVSLACLKTRRPDCSIPRPVILPELSSDRISTQARINIHPSLVRDPNTQNPISTTSQPNCESMRPRYPSRLRRKARYNDLGYILYRQSRPDDQAQPAITHKLAPAVCPTLEIDRDALPGQMRRGPAA